MKEINWTPEMDAMLGEDHDRIVASKLKITEKQVRYRRHKLGLLSHGAYKRNLRDNEIIDKWEELQNMAAVGRIFGLSRQRIAQILIEQEIK